MPEKIILDLGNVQKTMLLPLWGRAYETKKAEPLLVDKTAAAIIEKIDYDFAALTSNMNPLTQLAWIMRSICVDTIIKEFLEKHPKGTVVNIGCGLDTTFDRIDNGLLTWYDLDLPDVIALRQKFIPESDRRTYIRSSFLEDGWLGEIKTGDGVLFIAAGVFYYFEAEQVRGFLKKLADRFPGAEVLFDASSPQGIKTANRLVIKSAGLDERSFLKWGLSHPRDLLAWDKRFKVLKTMYYFRDRRLPLRARMIGLISDLLKIQYMVHLGLGKDS